MKSKSQLLSRFSSGLALSFRGISRLVSDFLFLRRFKLALTCLQVTNLHNSGKQVTQSANVFFVENRFHVTLHILSPKSVLKIRK